MEKYDGSSDPIDHLRAFVNLMMLRATIDAIMCRAFRQHLGRRQETEWQPCRPRVVINSSGNRKKTERILYSRVGVQRLKKRKSPNNLATKRQLSLLCIIGLGLLSSQKIFFQSGRFCKV
ncbi:Uncharacterized protein Fot_09371 [Forsythia ovata]|uniref:Uncharacterized protein n=1 Tax=Forsythia ovata TaxID=205694 RepID=A0ABD1WDU0_9LAMI